jgi:hypothetical protein
MPNLLKTVFIVDTTQTSDALDELRLRPWKRSITVAWKSGHYSTHANVRRRDMLRLLDPRQSFGQWVNRYVLG